jgi:hypothetical protein
MSLRHIILNAIFLAIGNALLPNRDAVLQHSLMSGRVSISASNFSCIVHLDNSDGSPAYIDDINGAVVCVMRRRFAGHDGAERRAVIAVARPSSLCVTVANAHD